jgi:hypothetical protein
LSPAGYAYTPRFRWSIPAVAKDVSFDLKKGTPAYRVVSVLQEQFKTPSKQNDDGTTTAARKLQGRLLLGAVIEAVFEHASAETLAALADEVKDKGDGDKKGKASEYIAAITAARAAGPAKVGTKDYDTMSDAELEAEEARIAAAKAKREAAKKPGGKTTGVTAL